MKKRNVIMLTAIIGLTGCDAGSGGGSKLLDASNNSRDMSAQAIREVNAAKADPKKCKSPHYTNAKYAAQSIGNSVQVLHEHVYVGSSYSDAVDRLFRNAVSQHTQALFYIGDNARTAGCKNIAKEAYSDVLNLYTGNNYAGHRDRAMTALNKL